MPHRAHVLRLAWVAVIALLVATSCSTSTTESSVAEATTTTSASMWGTLTGKLDVTFPLSGGPVTLNGATVELESGEVVDAAVPSQLRNATFGADMRVRVVSGGTGNYDWTIVEIEGGPVVTTTGGSASTGTSGTTRPPGVVVALRLYDEGVDGPQGLEPDLMRMIADEMGLPIDDWVIARDTEELQMMLLAGGADVVVGVSPGDLLFAGMASNPVYCVGQSVLVSAGNPLDLTDYQSVAAAGARIGVVEEDPDQQDMLRSAGVEADDIIPFPFREIEEWYSALADGELDAIAILASAPHWNDFAPTVTEPSLEMTPAFFPEGTPQACLGAAAFDQELLAAVDAAIASLHAAGSFGSGLAEYGLDPVQAEFAAGLTVEDLTDSD